jgi:recombination protein RecA
MQEDKLRRAVGAIHVRFGGQALVRASRLPAAPPWPSGLQVADRLSGIGGLPRGRISVLQGTPASGRLSLGLAALARATREFARPVALDPPRGFDPWTLARLGGDPSALTLIRPASPAVAGEAAVALARAGAGFLLVLGPLPEPALAPLESAAARSGCLVLVVLLGDGEPDRALAYASSLTLQLRRLGWLGERHQVVGVRSEVRCTKNRLAAPGAEAEVEVRYPLAPGRVPAQACLRAAAGGADDEPGEDGWWSERSAAG